MNQERLEQILCCPRCQGGLDLERGQCRGCGRPFAVHGGVIDLLDRQELTCQESRELELHAALAAAYTHRYSTPGAALFSRYWNEQFLRFLPEKSGTFLDCGCGTGALALDLAATGGTVVGVDISPAMLAVAATASVHPERTAWVAATASPLPCRDRSFDAVTFRGALHHLADEMAALAEARRVLKDGGMLLLSEPNDDSLLLRLPRFLARRLTRRFGNVHKAFHSKTFLAAITTLGFEIVDVKYFSFFSQPLCGMSDILGTVGCLPASQGFARGLIRLDETCSRLPLIRRQSFELFVAARKMR